MPLYEFVCTKCEHCFDALCDIDEDVKCEKCGAPVSKLISKSNWCINTSCTNPLPPKEKSKSEKKEEFLRESRILLDFICEECKNTDERLIYPSEMDNQMCEKCNKKMIPLAGCTHYKLEYNPKTDMCNWNGETSMYWSKVKEERRKGKNVKGLGEQ